VVLDLLGFGKGFWIVPDQVLADFVVLPQRSVGGYALVRTDGLCLARDEQFGADVLRWDVVARRQAGLEEYLRPTRLRDDLAVYANFELSRV
jgi:hypothetical protein